MKAIELAQYIVNKCIYDGHPITNMQLQNILFCIQKDYLQHGRIAFNDDFEAWTFGPCIPEVFYHYSGFGAMPIDIE